MSTPTHLIAGINAVDIASVAGLANKIRESPEVAATVWKATVSAANANAAGIAINGLSIELEGDLDLHTFLGLNPDGNAGYEAIRVNVDIDTDATPDEVTELHEKVVGTSPVGYTLSRVVPIRNDLV